MQLKHFLAPLAILCLCAGTTHAQNLDSSFYSFKSDTIVIKKNVKGTLLAVNDINKPKVYKHVPFAIDTAYFGEKIEDITGYTESYLRNHERTITTVKGRSEKVFPLIDSILDLNKIPKELKYLAVIESALNNHARSRVGAVGPWQFMSYTGREMGLVIRGNRDDRKDWVRSTGAAAKYMMKLYEDLDDWLLVIAAYNSGPRPVKRAIARTGSTNFWDIKPYLPRETQNHVLAFIATATIYEKLDHYIGADIPDVISYSKPVEKKKVPQPRSRFSTEELKQMAIIRITEPIYLDLLSSELQMDLKTLRHWNFDYEDFEFGTFNTEVYNLRIPKEKLKDFLTKKEVLYQRSKQIYADQRI